MGEASRWQETCQEKWQNFEVDRGSSLAYRGEFQADKKTSHISENYKGKNPMTRSQWRREKRRRKAQREVDEKEKNESSTNVPARKKEGLSFDKRKLTTPAEAAREKYDRMAAEDKILTDNFDSGSDTSLDILVGVVFVMPREFDQITEVEDTDNTIEIEIVAHKPICYYVMTNGYVEEKNAFFERPNEAMKSHLKPLFITGKIKDVPINKILVDCDAMVNLILHHMLRKIGKYDTDAKPRNMVLSNYEGKVGSTLGVIQVYLTVGIVTRSAMFMIVEMKANYNLLLGREWIHGVGVVPSSMHQRIIIWRPNAIMENIKVDQGYFKTPINHTNRRQFDKNLANITPCDSADFAFTPNDNAYCSLSLHPYNGFHWDREVVGEDDFGYLGASGIEHTCWGSEFSADD